MPGTPVNGSALPTLVDRWLLPLDGDQACGPDLEYDPEALDVARAAGKPESQFGPAEPADWWRVRELCESLLARTRDLRFALWWSRAAINIDGFEAVPVALALLHRLLDGFWGDLHPRADDDDPDSLARLSVIGGLDKLDSLLGDIRNALLSTDARLNGLRVRDVEIAMSRLVPRADETAMTQRQVAGMLASAPEAAATLYGQVAAALSSVGAMEALMSERFRADIVIDLAVLRGMLTSIRSVLPESAATPAAADDAAEEAASSGDAPAAAGAAVVAATRALGGVHSVDTREDAVRAIELVCAYLERHEPTNPAQLLLRRAARVIDKNFLELVHELAPDSVKEVARIMGVDPSTLGDQG